MRNKIAVTKNVAALLRAYESLAGRDRGIPGIGLLHGQTGAGKTTATAWLVNRTNGVYLRAAATWTPSSMLGRAVVELGGEAATHRGSAQMVDFIVRRLAEENRPLFVDEADYLFRDLRMLETLRDIHDLSEQPVLMIGMEGIARRLVSRQQLSGRISQWVDFLPADLEDARTLAATVCEVQLEDELLDRLHAEAKGSMRLMAVGLARVEALAKGNGWKKVGVDQWGERKFFFGAPGAGK